MNFSIKIQVSVTVIRAFNFDNDDTIFVISYMTQKMERCMKYFCFSLL